MCNPQNKKERKHPHLPHYIVIRERHGRYKSSWVYVYFIYLWKKLGIHLHIKKCNNFSTGDINLYYKLGILHPYIDSKNSFNPGN